MNNLSDKNKNVHLPALKKIIDDEFPPKKLDENGIVIPLTNDEFDKVKNNIYLKLLYGDKYKITTVYPKKWICILCFRL